MIGPYKKGAGAASSILLELYNKTLDLLATIESQHQVTRCMFVVQYRVS